MFKKGDTVECIYKEEIERIESEMRKLTDDLAKLKG